MMKRRGLLRVFLAVAGGVAAVQGLVAPARAAAIAKDRVRRTAMTAHDFDFVSIDGAPLPLRGWKGKPVLVVNTASFCGYTPQYKGLEALWRRYKDRGLVLLGVPSNDFGGQEPGSAAEIKAFCETYDVSFPLAGKAKVTGTDAHPFYRWIAAELGDAGVPRWNFHKYLVDGEGLLVGAWPSAVTPESAEITGAVEATLPKG